MLFFYLFFMLLCIHFIPSIDTHFVSVQSINGFMYFHFFLLHSLLEHTSHVVHIMARCARCMSLYIYVYIVYSVYVYMMVPYIVLYTVSLFVVHIQNWVYKLKSNFISACCVSDRLNCATAKRRADEMRPYIHILYSNNNNNHHDIGKQVSAESPYIYIYTFSMYTHESSCVDTHIYTHTHDDTVHINSQFDHKF